VAGALTRAPAAVIGVLRGYDPLVNLVLDECEEYLRGKQPSSPTCTLLVMARCSPDPSLTMLLSLDPDDPYKLLEEMRSLGLVVARGPSVMLICPMDGGSPPLYCAAVLCCAALWLFRVDGKRTSILNSFPPLFPGTAEIPNPFQQEPAAEI